MVEKELTLQEKLDLLNSIGEEIIEDKGQLEWLLQNRKDLVAYDGFEPSGNIHIAQGLMRAININKMTKCGIKFKLLVADWHAAANNKFDGDLEVIKKVGDFFIEVWKACDLDLSKVEFIYASDVVRDPKYWELVLKISMVTSLNRALRCTQIMGRKESDNLQASQILYPMMQCADIFHLKVDICQLGLDQRKVNMLAREVGPLLGFKHKPIAIHHHMLMSLKEPPKGDMDEIDKKVALKMSKSDPDGAIFMLDSEEDIKRKIKKAWCPPNEITENPVLEYCKYILYEKFNELEVKRPEQYGGNAVYKSYRELEAAYENGSLSPVDLKNCVIEYLNKLLGPIRKHFETDTKAKELLDFVKQKQAEKLKAKKSEKKK